MGKSAPETSVPDDILAWVRRITEHVWGPQPLDADGIMQAIHGAYLLVCGAPHGHSIAGLRAAAGHFTEAAAVVAAEKRQPQARIVGSLGKGLALLRAGDFTAAANAFAEVRSSQPAAQVLTAAALCWQANAQSLARKHRAAQAPLRTARAALKRLNQPGRYLPGLLALTEALFEYESGHFAAAQARLDAQPRAFYSRYQPDLPDLRGFEAEALLLRGKVLRDLARYEQALLTVERAQSQRRRCGDLLGEAWGCLEKARLYRFSGDYDRAHNELDTAALLTAETDFSACQARIHDQRGDLLRLQNKIAEADREYTQAERLAEATADPLLRAHVVNSRARLLEEQGRFKDAWRLLRGRQRFWRGKKEHPKQLYLMASQHLGLENAERAETLLKQACAAFHRLGMRAHEALALNRLAGLYADRGRAARACECWSAALRVADDVETTAILARLRDAVNRLSAMQLLPVVAELTGELKTVRAATRRREAAEAQVQERRLFERHLIGHWFAAIVHRHHWPPDGSALPMPAFMEEFAFLLDTYDWHLGDFARAPAPSTEVNLGPMITEAAAKAGCAISLARRSRDATIRVHQGFLELVLHCLLRGARTAFGTTTFRADIRRGTSATRRRVVAIRLVDPAPVGFERIEGLVSLDHALDNSEYRRFFERGYTGDLSLAFFVVRVALWGAMRYDLVNRIVLIDIPEYPS
ncbi:MAG: hypothetical protein L6R00_19305 [Phycisphaerae bacterium]|nr:hypothetical protein [Phycisphaerae bacterium]